MNTKICCFTGHSKIFDTFVKDKIKSAATDLIENHNIKEFWVGNYGEFDRKSAFVLKKLKKEYSDISINLIIPYLTNELNEYRDIYYKNFDNILVADIPEKTPPKFKIIKANEYMVDNSCYMICYVDCGWGGATKTLAYAKRKHVQIINLANDVN